MSSVPHSSGLAAPPVPARGASDPGPTSLSDYGTALARRWWLVLLGLLIGGAAAAGYLNVVHKTYTSTAGGAGDRHRRERLGDSRTARVTTTANVDMDTEAQIVTSNTVASLAAKGLNTSLTPSQLAAKVKVTVPPNSAVLIDLLPRRQRARRPRLRPGLRQQLPRQPRPDRQGDLRRAARRPCRTSCRR